MPRPAYLAFAEMLLGGGTYRGRRVLSRPAVELMTSDQLTRDQEEGASLVPGWFDDNGYGFGVGVVTRRREVGPAVRAYRWAGGLRTSWNNDPAGGIVAE